MSGTPAHGRPRLVSPHPSLPPWPGASALGALSHLIEVTLCRPDPRPAWGGQVLWRHPARRPQQCPPKRHAVGAQDTPHALGSHESGPGGGGRGGHSQNTHTAGPGCPTRPPQHPATQEVTRQPGEQPLRLDSDPRTQPLCCPRPGRARPTLAPRPVLWTGQRHHGWPCCGRASEGRASPCLVSPQARLSPGSE